MREGLIKTPLFLTQAMKRITKLIAIGGISSIIVLVGGLMAADKTKYHNDFIRIFPPHAADINSIFNIKLSRPGLIGLSGGNIYIQNSTEVLEMKATSGDTNRVPLKVPLFSHVSIDSPYFFRYSGMNARLERGDLKTWKIDTTFADIPGFTAIRMISEKDAVIQTIKISERQNILTKLNAANNLILQKQIDGLLCTDGLLQFSKEFNQLIYIYRYRNQFICMDTSLDILRYGKTIDTTSIAKISVAEVDGKITMSKPPLAVNNDAIVDGKYLFIQSNLIARNELPDRVKNKSVIDVYDIMNVSYSFSFYIETYKGYKMQEFKVKDNKLAALFNQAVIIYDLPSQYLP